MQYTVMRDNKLYTRNSAVTERPHCMVVSFCQEDILHQSLSVPEH